MPHWRLYYHVVWATRGRAPLLTPPCHELVERSVRATARDQHVKIHAVGIVVDHVHVVASIPPAASVGTVIGKLKGASSRLLNTAGPYSGDISFGWQDEYGVYSISERSLPQVCAYVNDQQRRHAADDLIRGLELTASP